MGITQLVRAFAISAKNLLLGGNLASLSPGSQEDSFLCHREPVLSRYSVFEEGYP